MRRLALPKNHTVFQFQLPQPDAIAETLDLKSDKDILDENMGANALVFEVHGDSFEHRAVERATKKFKPRNLAGL